MIENHQQYEATKTQAKKFELALERLSSGTDAGDQNKVHPLLQKAESDALQSVLSDLRQEIEEWESVTGKEGINTKVNPSRKV